MRQRAYCTVAEAAAILGVPERTIAYRLSRGLMQGERAGARLWLIRARRWSDGVAGEGCCPAPSGARLPLTEPRNKRTLRLHEL
jgi:hypothetical protein